MILTKIETIDVFLSQSFADGIFFRELRLSQEEAGYVQNKFPKASVKKCPSLESHNGKYWYEVNLIPPDLTENNHAAFEQETFRFEEELEAL